MNEDYRKKAEKLGVPVIPPNDTPPYPNNNDVKAICGQCGIEILKVMGYCCSHSNCPTGMGPTIV